MSCNFILKVRNKFKKYDAISVINRNPYFYEFFLQNYNDESVDTHKNNMSILV